MTDLGCCVSDCVHNESQMCCRGTIKVGGEDAKSACCTYCESVQQKGSGSGATNSTHQPDHKINISCDALNCKYNDSTRCTAGHVDVKNSSDTVHGQTECATFQM